MISLWNSTVATPSPLCRMYCVCTHTHTQNTHTHTRTHTPTQSFVYMFASHHERDRRLQGSVAECLPRRLRNYMAIDKEQSPLVPTLCVWPNVTTHVKVYLSMQTLSAYKQVCMRDFQKTVNKFPWAIKCMIEKQIKLHIPRDAFTHRIMLGICIDIWYANTQVHRSMVCKPFIAVREDTYPFWKIRGAHTRVPYRIPKWRLAIFVCLHVKLHTMFWSFNVWSEWALLYVCVCMYVYVYIYVCMYM